MKKEQMTVDRLEDTTVILQDLQENILHAPIALFADIPREGEVFFVETDENGAVLSAEPLPDITQKRRISVHEKMQLLRMRAKNRK